MNRDQNQANHAYTIVVSDYDKSLTISKWLWRRFEHTTIDEIRKIWTLRRVYKPYIKYTPPGSFGGDFAEYEFTFSDQSLYAECLLVCGLD